MPASGLNRFAGTLVALLLGLGACAQGEEAAGPQTGTEATSAASAKLARTCDANLAVEKGFNKLFAEMGPEGEGPPTPEQVKQIQDAIDKEILPHVEAVETSAPEDISNEVTFAAASVRKFRADPAGYNLNEDKEAHEAIERMEKHFFEKCDYEKATVQAADYEFRNVPSEIKSGEDLVVKLDNRGKELHEFVVLAKKEGVTESWDDILKMERPEAEQKTQFIGASFASPGKQDVGVFTFKEPGDYIAACFIPQGTTSEKQLEGPEGEKESPPAISSPPATSGAEASASPTPTPADGEAAGEGGPPHFTLGMKAELKVE